MRSVGAGRSGHRAGPGAHPVSGCGQPGAITAGPDGALWFTGNIGSNGVNGLIGRITTAGAITEFPIPSGSTAMDITAGPDGALWFTELIARLAASRPPA